MPLKIRSLWTQISRKLLYLWKGLIEALSNGWSYLFANLLKILDRISQTLAKIAASVKKVFLRIWGGLIFVASILLMIVARSNLVKTLTPDDQSLLQNFIEWYAVIYTLVLSVIVGQGWRKYNRINNEIDREADSLVLLVQTGRMFKDENLSQALFLAVKRYVKCLLLLQSNDHRIVGESHEKMKDIRGFVVLLIKSDEEESLKSELLHQYNEAYDARGDRFDLIEQKLPQHMWIIFIVASLIWLWGFLWLEFDSFFFGTYILGATVLSISYLFYLARDLDDPTKGAWRMKFTSFETHIF